MPYKFITFILLIIFTFSTSQSFAKDHIKKLVGTWEANSFEIEGKREKFSNPKKYVTLKFKSNGTLQYIAKNKALDYSIGTFEGRWQYSGDNRFIITLSNRVEYIFILLNENVSCAGLIKIESSYPACLIAYKKH